MKGVRSLAVLVAVAVACSLLAVALASGAAAQDGATEIDSCTEITEPGEYELVDDIQTDEEDSCIVVTSSDVTIDGNGHTVEGPGAPEDYDLLNPMAAVFVDEEENVTVRNVELVGWQEGLQSGIGGFGDPTSTTAEDVVVRETHNGIEIEGQHTSLTNVTVEHSENGIKASESGDLDATDVTLRQNNDGVSAEEAGELHFKSSRITNNDDDGISGGPGVRLRLTDTSVSGNGHHGIDVGFNTNSLTIEGGEVTDNGAPGVHAWGGSTDVRLDDVTMELNDGLEVNGDPEDRRAANITASDLRVGPSATAAFEAEPIRLAMFDRGVLPPREGGTAAGHGLIIGGTIEGPVDLELVVETDDDAVDLWRHDGDEWETVEEDLPVTDGTVEATVERNGTYAPGTTDEGDGDPSTIDSCTVIDDPGEYELVDDIQTDEEDSCIVVNSSDVALHGNGHVVSGPGPDEPASPDYAGILVDGAYQDYYRNVTVRDVEVADFDQGIKTGSGGFGDNTNATVEDTVVRDNIQGIYHEGGALTLRNVVAEGSARDGLYALEAGHVRGTNLTVRANAQGVGGDEVGGGIRLGSSTVTNNDNSGVFGGSNVALTLIDTEVSNNGNFGVVTYTGGRSITVKGGSVTDNGDVGIRAGGYGGGHSELSDVTVARNGEEGILLRDGTLTNVTATDNEGLELRGRNVTAQAFRVGSYATTAFENEDVNLEPVDREALPPREAGTVAGDGLNVSGDVDGPVELELDFDNDGTNDDTVDLWRHDGDEWETVEEDAVTDGTIEATVERTGTYAPGTDDEEDSDGAEDESDDTDGSDGSEDSGDGSDGTGDSDGAKDGDRDGPDGDASGDGSTDGGTSDEGGQTDQATATPASDASGSSGSGGSAGSGGGASGGTTATTAATATPGPTGVEPSDPGADDDADEAAKEGTETSGSDEGDTGTDATGDDPVETEDDDISISLADGPGFGPLAALLALAASGLFVRRRG